MAVNKAPWKVLSHMRSFRYLPSAVKQIRDCVLPSRFLVLLDLLAKGPLSPVTGAAWSERERLVMAWGLPLFCGWSGLMPEILSRELSRRNASLRIISEPRLWFRGLISATSESRNIKGEYLVFFVLFFLFLIATIFGHWVGKVCTRTQ